MPQGQTVLGRSNCNRTVILNLQSEPLAIEPVGTIVMPSCLDGSTLQFLTS
jgi:hypothetical protein